MLQIVYEHIQKDVLARTLDCFFPLAGLDLAAAK